MTYQKNYSKAYICIMAALEIAVFLFAAFVFGCNTSNSDTVEPVLAPKGVVTSYTECKQSMSQPDVLSEQTPGTTCITYNYDGESRLELTHVDLLANCCATDLLGAVTFEGSKILITEGERTDDGACRCVCSYDMNIVITDLPPGDYRIVVDENYMFDGYDDLAFNVSLATKTNGSFCVTRPQN